METAQLSCCVDESQDGTWSLLRNETYNTRELVALPQLRIHVSVRRAPAPLHVSDAEARSRHREVLVREQVSAFFDSET